MKEGNTVICDISSLHSATSVADGLVEERSSDMSMVITTDYKLSLATFGSAGICIKRAEAHTVAGRIIY